MMINVLFSNTFCLLFSYTPYHLSKLYKFYINYLFCLLSPQPTCRSLVAIYSLHFLYHFLSFKKSFRRHLIDIVLISPLIVISSLQKIHWQNSRPELAHQVSSVLNTTLSIIKLYFCHLLHYRICIFMVKTFHNVVSI